jgi:tetratricopeptide (TPR) repeat protein
MNLLRILISVSMTLVLAACTTPERKAPAKAPSPEVQAKDPGGYYYYAESRLKRRHGELDEAIELLKEAVVRDESSMFLKNELVRLYLHQKDYKAALDVTQDIIQKHPEDVSSLVVLGGIYSALEQDMEAVQAYEKALALDPKSENIHLLLGSEYIRVKRTDEAMQLYKDLIQINPDSFAGYFYLGALNASLRHYEEAETALLKAIELKPDYERTYFELVTLYEETDNQEKVIETYKQILAANPDNLRAAIGLGRSYLEGSRRHIRGAKTSK